MAACLGPAAADEGSLDRALLAAIDGALAAIDTEFDDTGGTADYVELLTRCRRDVERGRLRWGDWAKLSGRLKRGKLRA